MVAQTNKSANKANNKNTIKSPKKVESNSKTLVSPFKKVLQSKEAAKLKIKSSAKTSAAKASIKVDPHIKHENMQDDMVVSERKKVMYDSENLNFNSTQKEMLIDNKSMTPMNQNEAKEILEAQCMNNISVVNKQIINRNHKGILFGDSNSFWNGSPRNYFEPDTDERYTTIDK